MYFHAFTTHLNNVFSCIYHSFEVKILISGRLGEQMFVYILLAAVTLLAGTA